ncbi:hypothetical protein [Neobacillus niacini]|uniref:hypothetical protein n=1 Tax=Neobacillus niacini TaxID=86668 RepID=UPI00203DDDA2|nr:hypothetical protein [Neobacillus niacini]MCM3690712.1 hypothetical protein [Neobacillus niacini]
MNTVTVDKLAFKKKLSMIEQFTIKDFLFKWVGSPPEGIDDILPLAYSEYVFAKMEANQEYAFMINENEHFRYATITENEQIVIGFLDYNNELKHRVITIDEVLNEKGYNRRY